MPHAKTVKSIEENKERFQKVRILRHILLGEELNLSMSGKAKVGLTVVTNVKKC